jgi:hypothetical protein
MEAEQDGPRELTTTERGIVVVVGVVMLILSLLSLGVTIALFTPMVRLVEGLSK